MDPVELARKVRMDLVELARERAPRKTYLTPT
jgi:hypothetical protein